MGLGVDQGTHPLGRQNAVSAMAGIDPETVAKVAEATAGAVEGLTGELQLCMRYYESIFPGRVVDRAMFVGGESRHIPMCQRIAQRLGVPATLGDPLGAAGEGGPERGRRGHASAAAGLGDCGGPGAGFWRRRQRSGEAKSA